MQGTLIGGLIVVFCLVSCFNAPECVLTPLLEMFAILKTIGCGNKD